MKVDDLKRILQDFNSIGQAILIKTQNQTVSKLILLDILSEWKQKVYTPEIFMTVIMQGNFSGRY